MPEATADLVLARYRPSLARAAAAARLAGVPADQDAVTARMRHAARRSATAAAVTPLAPAPHTVTAPTVVATSGGAALAVAAPRPEPEVAPRPRHLRVVPDGALSPAQRRRRARAMLVGGVGAAATIGLALVYFHVVLAQRQFAIDRLDSQVQQAQSTYQAQRLHVAQLGSPQHIISMAEGQLGMVQPANVTYLTPASPTSTVVPGGRPSSPPSTHGPAGDADWPQIKSQLAGTP